MDKRGYRDLHVWRESISFIPEVYAVLQTFPAHESEALAGQTRQAAVAVAAHIAEGHACSHRLEFLRHLRIAKGSLARLHTLFVIAEQVGYLTPGQLDSLEQGVEGISRPLNGFIAKLREKG